MSALAEKSPGDPMVLVQALEKRLLIERRRRQALETALRQREAPTASDPLEQLIDERTQALSLARDEAVTANLAKSSFLANMSHEIRTPLTSIIGFAEMLLDPQITPAERSDATATIIRNGRHLLEVINDVLDLSKIETRQLDVEQIEVRLPELLSEIEVLVAGRAQDKSLLFRICHHLPLPPSLCTDPVRVKQILLNLCSNAIKFSAHGEVRLDVRFDAGRDMLAFAVTDHGIGMTPQQQSRLFQPFVQADVSTTRQFGGSGLGLYISQQLAQMLGAQISVSSRVGVGSRFTLEVPVRQRHRPIDMLTDAREFDAMARPPFEITAIEVPALGGRVLLAEDGADNQRLLASYLRQAGLEVDIVGNGQLAVERAMQSAYALVLMDIQMPVMDGVAATRSLRAQDYRGPIVALTANVMKSDVAHYRQCGCDEVLAKPIDRPRFYAVVQRFLGGAIKAPEPDDAYARELAALTAEFLAGLPVTLERLRAAAELGDWPTVGGLAHTLKGTAGSYGFAAISQLAAEVELHLSAGHADSVVSLCAALARRGRALAAP
jgi:signal transduction histidine kinase/CheY-like chemotaxis protein